MAGAADLLQGAGGGAGELVDVLAGPGPAEREATVETISAYGTGLAEATAATIGAVAWPPQVIMFMFGASRCRSG